MDKKPSLRYSRDGPMSSLGPIKAGKAGVSANVGLMRRVSSHLGCDHRIEGDSRKTDGILGTEIVRQKTYGNLGRARRSDRGGLLTCLEIRLGSRDKPRSLRCMNRTAADCGPLPPPALASVHRRLSSVLR